MPFLTVTIPTKDRPSLLPRAVDSILNQVDDVEVIVVDDGSAAHNAEQIAALCASDPRIRLVRNDVPGGAPHGRNQGLAAAAGRYWATLDDDDAWLPGKWDAQFEILDRSDFASDVVVVCAIEPTRPEPDLTRQRPAISLPERPDSLALLFQRLPVRVFLNTYVVPTGLMRRIGGYDERFIWGEHTDVLIRLWRVARFAGTDHVGVAVDRWHPDAGGRTGRNWRLKVEGVSLLLDKHRDAFAAEPELRLVYRHVQAVSELRSGERRAAMGTLARALAAGPGLRSRARIARHLILATAGRSDPGRGREAHQVTGDETEPA